MPKCPTLPEVTDFDRRVQVRLIEAWQYISSEPPTPYPAWVPKMAGKLVRLLPRAVWEPAVAHPTRFIEGVQLALSLQGLDRLLTLPSKNLRQFNRVTQSAYRRAMRAQTGFDRRLDRLLSRFDVRTGPTEAARKIAKKITLPPLARESFFDGFAFGLKLTVRFDALMADIRRLFSERKRTDQNAVRFFLWLHWPEVETAPGRTAVFRMCREAFAAEGKTIGTESTFITFLKREGIKRRRP